MKSKSIKVIDEHNIDRDASVLFALELDGSEYVVYSITRDEESNNIFVSKVLKNIDGTYNMLNIDDEEKKKEVSEIVKVLISSAVTDQNDKLSGTGVTLSNGKVAKIVSVMFNKEQHISVAKTYITTVKKEVTKVAETYYDVLVEEIKVADVLPASPVATAPISVVSPVVEATPSVVPQPTPVVVEPITVAPTPVVTPAPVVSQPVGEQPAVATIPVASTPVTQVAEPAPVVPPVVETPVSPSVVVEPTPAVVPAQPVAAAPVVENVVETPVNPGLVFNAAKETNLNAALGEVASSTTIPVENIQTVREFGVENATPSSAVVSPVTEKVNNIPNEVVEKAGFANSKFFMFVAIAFFLASCIFLGYEVYNYFQLVQ